MPHWLAVTSTVFGVVVVLELPDKTALATLMLATRHKPVPVFWGAALAFVVQTVVAVFAGFLFGQLPREPIRIAAGLLFLAMAILIARRDPAAEKWVETEQLAREERRHQRPFMMAFTLVFLAEWGDLTQLATAALQAHYGRTIADTLTVFGAATAALWAVAGLAVVLGNRLGAALPERGLQLAAAAVMTLAGFLLIIGVLG